MVGVGPERAPGRPPIHTTLPAAGVFAPSGPVSSTLPTSSPGGGGEGVGACGRACGVTAARANTKSGIFKAPRDLREPTARRRIVARGGPPSVSCCSVASCGLPACVYNTAPARPPDSRRPFFSRHQGIDRQGSPPQRPHPAHRVHAPRAQRGHRRVAQARQPPRGAGAGPGISHFIEHMVFKGTSNRSAEVIAAAGGLDRRPHGRVHRQGVRVLPPEGARRAPAAGRGHPGRHRAPPAVRSRGDDQGEEGHLRGDQHGRGHARRPGDGALHRRPSGPTTRWAGPSWAPSAA